MALLSLAQVTKRHGDVVAVNAVDLEVPAGARMAVIGPSGSGKTSLLRLIAGFEAMDAGSIRLGGALLGDGQAGLPAHKRQIGYVAQEGALFPHLSIGDNIGFGLDRADPDRANKIAKLMARVGLSPSMVDRRPHQVSGGQQQRVALARALARKPRLMLLDEPFSALDAGLRESMRHTVSDILGAAGITTILVTHDQTEALSFADHLAVLRDGRLVQAGLPEDLYHRPKDAFVAQFLGEAILFDVEMVEGVAQTPLGLVVTDRPKHSGRGQLLLRPEQITVRPGRDGAVARVIGRSFRGPYVRLTVVPLHSATREIALMVSNSTAPAVGDHVRLEFNGTAHMLG